MSIYKWLVFIMGRTSDPIGEVEASTKREAERFTAHVIGPHNIDLKREPVTPPSKSKQHDWWNGR